MVYKRYTHDIHFGPHTNKILSGFMVAPMLDNALLSGAMVGTGSATVTIPTLDVTEDADIQHLEVKDLGGATEPQIKAQMKAGQVLFPLTVQGVSGDDVLYLDPNSTLYINNAQVAALSGATDPLVAIFATAGQTTNLFEIYSTGPSTLQFAVNQSGVVSTARLDKPTIYDFTNMQHDHSDAASGGTISGGGATTTRDLTDVEDVAPTVLDFMRYEDQTPQWRPAAITFTSPLSISDPGEGNVDSSVSIQDASTSQKGAAQFNSSHFSASAGTISLAADLADLDSVDETGKASLDFIRWEGGVSNKWEMCALTAASPLSISTPAAGTVDSQFSIQDASTSQKGAAQFDSTDFSVSAGNVTLNNIEGHIGHTMWIHFSGKGSGTVIFYEVTIGGADLYYGTSGWPVLHTCKIGRVVVAAYHTHGSDSGDWTLDLKKNETNTTLKTLTVTQASSSGAASVSSTTWDQALSQDDRIHLQMDGPSTASPRINGMMEIILTAAH